MKNTPRYVRREDFEARIDQVELPVEVWTVFAELSEPRDITELNTRTSLACGIVQQAVDQLVTQQLARKLTISWRDFAAIKAATTAPFPTPAAVKNAIVSVQATEVPTNPPLSTPPKAVAPAPTPAVHRQAVRPTPISFRISSPDATTVRPPAISLRIAPGGITTLAQPNPTPAKTSMWKLRPVLDAIGGKAGGGVAGQLLIYRVFLQIPTELMQAAGLHSLSLINNDFTVTHPEFRSALAEAARKHADVDIDQLPAA